LISSNALRHGRRTLQFPPAGLHFWKITMRHPPRTSPPRRAAIELPPKKSPGRWFAFGLLCAMVGLACFIDRFPVLAG
jgi:hypothetical protein